VVRLVAMRHAKHPRLHLRKHALLMDNPSQALLRFGPCLMNHGITSKAKVSLLLLALSMHKQT
jgi:hypothetical protein